MREKTILSLVVVAAVAHLLIAALLMYSFIMHEVNDIIGPILYPPFTLLIFIFLPLLYLRAVWKSLFRPQSEISSETISPATQQKFDIYGKLLLSNIIVLPVLGTFVLLLASSDSGFGGLLIVALGVIFGSGYLGLTLFSFFVRPGEHVRPDQVTQAHGLQLRLRKYAVHYIVYVGLMGLLYVAAIYDAAAFEQDIKEIVRQEATVYTENIVKRFRPINETPIGAGPEILATLPDSDYSSGRPEGDSFQALETYRKYITDKAPVHRDDILVLDGFLLKFKACSNNVRFYTRRYREGEMFLIYIDERLALRMARHGTDPSGNAGEDNSYTFAMDPKLLSFKNNQMSVCGMLTELPEDNYFSKTTMNIQENKLILDTGFYSVFWRVDQLMLGKPI